MFRRTTVGEGDLPHHKRQKDQLLAPEVGVLIYNVDTEKVVREEKPIEAACCRKEDKASEQQNREKECVWENTKASEEQKSLVRSMSLSNVSLKYRRTENLVSKEHNQKTSKEMAMDTRSSIPTSCTDGGRNNSASLVEPLDKEMESRPKEARKSSDLNSSPSSKINSFFNSLGRKRGKECGNGTIEREKEEAKDLKTEANGEKAEKRRSKILGKPLTGRLSLSGSAVQEKQKEIQKMDHEANGSEVTKVPNMREARASGSGAFAFLMREKEERERNKKKSETENMQHQENSMERKRYRDGYQRAEELRWKKLLLEAEETEAAMTTVIACLR